jgi:hypothetical protein
MGFEDAQLGEPLEGPFFRELDEKLTKIVGELTEPVHIEAVTEWTANIPELKDTIWGSIQWRKSLGRPAGRRPADGFSILHQSHPPGPYDAKTGKFVDLPAPHNEPTKWDGPEDDEYYRVTFMVWEAPNEKQSVDVGFAFPLRWKTGSESVTVKVGPFRKISPSSQGWNGGDPGVLGPFEVL